MGSFYCRLYKSRQALCAQEGQAVIFFSTWLKNCYDIYSTQASKRRIIAHTSFMQILKIHFKSTIFLLQHCFVFKNALTEFL